MKQRRDFNTLMAALEKDRTLLVEIVTENKRAAERITAGATDSLDYAALGYTLHNIYCLFENYFLRIAKFFENNLDQTTWHKDLVRRMTLDIPEVRPPLLDDSTAEMIDELRAFRHLFRNLYQTKIKPRKVEKMQELLPQIIDGFTDAHYRFIEKLQMMREALDE